jgi:predicted transport protein
LSDIKLFRIGASVHELLGSSVVVDKALRALIEAHLDTFLGVRFLASGYSTGRAQGRRVDTLGIDENNSPVVIEYKRSLNHNVINRGLSYLDWLLEHRGEFALLAMKRVGVEVQGNIDWSSPRLICIAGDFTRHDRHEVSGIDRPIELVRYRKYDNEFMVLELVNATNGTLRVADTVAQTRAKRKTVSDSLDQSPAELRGLYQATEDFIVALGEDVTRKITRTHIAFRRIKNFVCIEIHPQSDRLLVYLKVDPEAVTLETGFTRDVRAVGHAGTGDLEVTIADPKDLDRAKSLIITSYQPN